IPSWLGRRYIRTALPDAFNVRVGGAIKEARASITEFGDNLDALYIIVDDDEKPTGEPFRIVLRGTVFESVWTDGSRRAAAQQAFNAVETALAGADGIEVVDSRLLSEADVSLHDVRAMRRWDIFDDTSVRGGSPASRFARRPGR
ncbi:MAG: hypothetical protein WEC14_08385, partial [Chloroflexota bacterium]